MKFKLLTLILLLVGLYSSGCSFPRLNKYYKLIINSDTLISEYVEFDPNNEIERYIKANYIDTCKYKWLTLTVTSAIFSIRDNRVIIVVS